MTRHLYSILGLSGLLLAAALFFAYYVHKSDKLRGYAQKIESHLQKEEKKVDSFFKNKAYIHRQLASTDNSSFTQIEKDFNFLNRLSTQTFTISIYQNDSLVFWTNNFAFPDAVTVKNAGPDRDHQLMVLKNGSYEMIRQKFIDPKIGAYTLIGLIPIKFSYQLDSKYLEPKFSAAKSIPTQLVLNDTKSDFPIQSYSGETVAYLSSPVQVVNAVYLQWLLILILLAYLTFAIFLTGLAQHWIKIKPQWQGAALLIVGLFGIRGLMIVMGFSDYFSVLPLFNKNFDTSLSDSLGDLLINIALLFWMMVFFYREIKIPSLNHLSFKAKFWYTTINYYSILIGILLITGVFKTLVFNTNISFDFDNVFNLDWFSLIAILGVIILLMALYLFSHRIMLTIVNIGLNWFSRLGALSIALVASMPLLYLFDLLLPFYYIILIAFVFIQIFDLFIDSKELTFTWLVVWLVILSAFPSILLFKYNAYRDRTVRLSYAKELSNLRDQAAEKAFFEIKQKIKEDTLVKNLFNKPFPFKVEETKVNQLIDPYYSHDNYLFYNYHYKVSAFNKYQKSAIKNQKETYSNLLSKKTTTQNILDEELLFRSEEGKLSYLLHLEIPTEESEDSIELVLEFARQKREPSKVYTELLIDKQYKNLKELDKYQYAIYKDSVRIDAEGKIYGSLLTIDNLPPPGKSIELIHENRSDLIYQGENGIVVLLGREKETFLKAISLFSYIFGMLISLVLGFTLINTLIPILPNTVSFSISSKPSLKNRIQLSVISLIVVSFVIIGFVTVWFFRTSSEDYHESRLERKTSSVLTDAQHEIELLIKSQIRDSILDLREMVIPISEIHRIDVNLYDLNGQLVNSSEGDIFNRGILAPWMPSLAFQALAKQGLSEFIQETEKVGDLTYKASYVPLTDLNNHTLAYLGLPYYSKQSKLRSDITIFMSTLLNVYVFLLLIAGGIAIMVANSITKPLAIIGEKLKQLRLGKSNEPLEWRSKDELGTLIEEYNKMIFQLDDSADRLAQSERESAWREMAKQVAHEIKNPLTPMKLSIQYLQHAYRSNPENIEPLLKRVSSTLIEQIDNLAQIASEFSNFAKMPRAENQEIHLNKLISSVFLLFSKEREDVEMTLNVPKEQYFVFADKNHLMRVFNNLIKNALQAIPEDRQGIIHVSLYLNGDLATIKVSDNGTGISEDKKEKVFVPNFTTKSSGTGLGLAISKNIIESVEGKIYFHTEEGKGTDFYVELPLVEIKQLEEV